MATEKESWWEVYRKRPSTRLNMELIFRKTVRDTAKEYFSECHIVGVKEIRDTKSNIRQRLLHIVLVLGSCIMLFYLLRCTEEQTFSHPLIVTQETSTYPINLIDFPAIAICNVNRISMKALKKYATTFFKNLTGYRGINKWLQEEEALNETFITNYILQYGKLIDFSFTEDMESYNNFEQFESPQKSHVIVDMMKKLSPSCEEILLRCAWAGKVQNCSDIFTVRRTAKGHCCVFNYVLSYHSAGRPNRSMLMEVKRQHERGRLYGLNLVLDPLIEDYAYPIRATEGFDVFLFDPTNYADPSGGRLIHRFIGPNELSILELHSVKQIAAPEVQHYPQLTRKCLFQDELEEAFGDMYSYSTCIVNCRIKTVKTLCKCTPYFLPISLDGGLICTLERLRCLNKYKEKLLYQYPYGAESLDGLEMEVEDALACPECLPDCEFTQHYTKAFKMPITFVTSNSGPYKHKTHKNNFVDGFNLTNKCILIVYQSNSDGSLNRLDVVSYWFEILSNVGGYAGILLGFSIISVMEIIYFFVFRFPRILYLNFKKYH